MEKIIAYKGIIFKVEDCGEVTFSVKCLEPCFDDDGLDHTHWPDDEQVSEWIGRAVRCIDAGDDPDHPEAIYEAEITAEDIFG